MRSRREFLSAAAATVPTLALASRFAKAPVVDTHLHCFAGANDARFPYHKDGPYAPTDAATPEMLLKCMDGAGVDFAVVVHPEPYQDDHRYLEHCLAVGKGRLKGTCLFFAERADTSARLRELAKKVPLVAVRVHAYSEGRLPPFGKPELRALWKLAGELGLAVQIHLEPRWAESFEPYLKEFADVKVIVDHLGRPFQGTEKEHARVMGWSDRPNVVMKLSSIPDRGSYPHRDPALVIRQLADAYGPDRLIYGGGFGAKATGETYRKERERIAGFISHLSETDRAKIFGGNALKLMGF